MPTIRINASLSFPAANIVITSKVRTKGNIIIKMIISFCISCAFIFMELYYKCSLWVYFPRYLISMMKKCTEICHSWDQRSDYYRSIIKRGELGHLSLHAFISSSSLCSILVSSKPYSILLYGRVYFLYYLHFHYLWWVTIDFGLALFCLSFIHFFFFASQFLQIYFQLKVFVFLTMHVGHSNPFFISLITATNSNYSTTTCE